MASIPAPPKPAAHHAYKSWTSTWYDENGQRHFKRFGNVNEVSKHIARAKFDRWYETEWKAKASVRDGNTDTYTVKMLCTAYAAVALARYTKHGKSTSHISQVESALNALLTRFADRPADSIGAPEITRLVEEIAHAKNRHGEPVLLSTHTINGRLRIIKQAFAWARGKGLVSRECAVDISLTKSVRGDNISAKPAQLVRPVPMEIIQQTIAKAPKTIGDMIRVQLLTGMRPGELCDMRPCDIDTQDAKCWVYRPWRHKSEHHQKHRVIPLGKHAQKILKPYIAKRTKMNEPIFLPAEAHRERLEMIGHPKVKAYQMSRSVFKPGRFFTNGTYRGMVERATDRALDPKGDGRARRDYSHRWHPHQLRHNFATTIRHEFGIEAASDLLGHSQMNTALIYAERSLERAKDIAKKVG